MLCVQQARSRLQLLSHYYSSALDCVFIGSASRNTAVGIHVLRISSLGTQYDECAEGVSWAAGERYNA